MHINLGITASEVHNSIFRGTDLNLDYLTTLCRQLHDPIFSAHYLLGPHGYAGRPQLLPLGGRTLIVEMAIKEKSFRLSKLREEFADLDY
jgi:hypothetical protein